MNQCKGICNKYKVARPNDSSPYVLGLKRCNTCGVFLKINGLVCPCCKYKLRNNPRTKAQKKRLREALSLKNMKHEVLKSLVPAAVLSAISGICINHGIQHIFHSISNIM